MQVHFEFNSRVSDEEKNLYMYSSYFNKILFVLILLDNSYCSFKHTGVY